MLPDSASSLRRPPWLWLAWGLLLLVALGLGVRLMLQAGEDLLRRDAEPSQALARFIERVEALGPGDA